jgi:hypothetical protein
VRDHGSALLLPSPARDGAIESRSAVGRKQWNVLRDGLALRRGVADVSVISRNSTILLTRMTPEPIHYPMPTERRRCH